MFWYLVLIVPAALLAQQNAVECDSTTMSSLEQSGRRALASGTYTTAAEQFRAAYSVCTAKRTLLLDLSRALVVARRRDRCGGSSQQYLGPQPRSWPWQSGLTSAYCMAQRLRDARKVAVRVHPEQADHWGVLKIKTNEEYLSG